MTVHRNSGWVWSKATIFALRKVNGTMGSIEVPTTESVQYKALVTESKRCTF
jgi:hypothetical protein